MSKDYYKILSVEKNASQEEIKKAFRKLAHEHHPDKGNGNEAKFKEALEAYQVLSNAEKRKQYDQFGTTFDQAGAQGFGGFSQGGFQGFDFSQVAHDFPDLSDILGDMFGFGGGRTRGQRAPRGRDIEKDVQLEFIEAVFGVTKKIELYAHVTCDHCNGSGGEPGSKIETCGTCEGSGRTQTVQRTILGNFQSVITCTACNGEGKKPEKECKRCGGVGITRDLKKLEVKIPAGAENGGVLRLMGQGEAAQRGGAAGDLYLRIYVKPHKIFERHGHDIFSKISITFKTAALGGKVLVETVDGPVELKIPAATRSNALFRLRSKGIPQMRSGSRGDHIVEVAIDVPKKLSRKQKKLLEEFDDE